MASISVRSGAPGSPTHVSGSSSSGGGGGTGGGGSPSTVPTCRSRRNGLQDVDLNTFISEEMALHLDSTGSASAGGGGTRKRNSTQCSDVITDSPTHKRNRLIWPTCPYVYVGKGGPTRSDGGVLGLCETDRGTDRFSAVKKKTKEKKKVKKLEHAECWFSLFGCCLLYLLLYIDGLLDVSVCADDESHSPLTSVLSKGDWVAPRSLKKRRHTVLLNEQKPLDLHMFVPSLIFTQPLNKEVGHHDVVSLIYVCLSHIRPRCSRAAASPVTLSLRLCV